MKNEIKRIIFNPTNDLIEIKGREKKNIVERIFETFVDDNPRALWLGFKYVPKLVSYEYDYPYLKIPDLVNESETLYLLIDDFNLNFYLLRGTIKDIIFFIEECEGLDEYYIVDKQIKRIICENDHDELIYIDIEKNPLIYK